MKDPCKGRCKVAVKVTRAIFKEALKLYLKVSLKVFSLYNEIQLHFTMKYNFKAALKIDRATYTTTLQRLYSDLYRDLSLQRSAHMWVKVFSLNVRSLTKNVRYINEEILKTKKVELQ